jgi:integrase/recombinase XerD
MNTNIVIALDTRHKKQSGLYPLVMRIGHKRTTTAIPLGFSIPEKDWDEKNRVVRKSYAGVSSVTRMNNLIQKQKADAMDIIMKLHESGELANMTVTAIKEKLDKREQHQSFFTYANQQMEELNKANRFGTARSYKGVVSVLKEYRNGKDLQFNEINYQFLTKFETHHASKGNTANGLSVYIRAVRAIFNKAIKSGIVDKDLYPFNDYKIRSVPTEKRALEWELLKKIIELQITHEHECFNARNYGIFKNYRHKRWSCTVP